MYSLADPWLSAERLDFAFIFFTQFETFHLIRLFGDVLSLVRSCRRYTFASITVLNTGNPFFMFNPASNEFR
jgi:hypothetical protein